MYIKQTCVFISLFQFGRQYYGIYFICKICVVIQYNNKWESYRIGVCALKVAPPTLSTEKRTAGAADSSEQFVCKCDTP